MLLYKHNVTLPTVKYLKYTNKPFYIVPVAGLFLSHKKLLYALKGLNFKTIALRGI